MPHLSRLISSIHPHFKSRIRFVFVFAILIALVVGALPFLPATPVLAATAAPGNGGFNYGEAFQKAILFYEAQRSGKLSTSSIPTRFTWRGDSQLLDGKDNGIDLTGGWVDAGDNVKFGLPMSEAVSVLAWGAVEYRADYTSSGQLKWLENQLRWADDWFIKAHVASNKLYGQVGLGSSDHSYWAPQEVTNFPWLTDPTAAGQPTSRPSYACTGAGSDLFGGTAAAMAASSIVFRPDDSAYADTLLSNAVQLDSTAQAAGAASKYTTCITDAANYYNSYSGGQDEMIWSDIWMAKAYEAKGDSATATTYWNKAKADYPKLGMEGQTGFHNYKWTYNWDDKTEAIYVLMSEKFPGDATGWNADAERWLDWWTIGDASGTKVTYTPGGHAHLDTWGSFRYAANTAFGAFVYADKGTTDTTKQTRYRNFAEQQINYILGQNPRNCSYLMGYGKCPPVRPHHRTAEGAWLNNMAPPTAHRHVLIGAVSGSVGTDDSFTDDVSNYVSTEPADDYNAGLVGALAKMYELFGGAPLSDATLASQITTDNSANYGPHACNDEYLAEVKVNSSGANFTEYSIYLNNRSGWPARASNTMKFKYFFTLDSGSISNIVAASAYPNGTTVTGPTLYSGNVYYVLVDYTGVPLYPGGQSPSSRREVQFRITDNSGTWDTTNDWSASGWTTTYAYPNTGYSYTPNIPVYDGSTLLCGTEPNGTQVTPSKTNTPGPTATTGPSATPVPPTKTNTPGPTATTGPTSTKPPASNTPTFMPPTSTAVTGGSLTVNIDKGGGTDNTQETTFNYQIKNSGSSAVSNLSVRIYFNTDGSNAASGYMMEKYYDQSGVATISAPTAACGATNYFTISYGTASLAAGASWEFQTALHLTSWGSTYDGSNDWYHSGYAVGALPAAYTATNFIPAYVNGTLTAGSTPSCGGTTVPTNPPPTATKPPATPTTGPTATKPPATNTPFPFTNTPTKVATTGPTATKPPATNTPVVTNPPPTATKTNTPVATSSGNCTPTSTITAPFTFDGVGTLCWKTNSLGSYINSWNLASLTINGVNITNVYVASGSYPAKASDGFWYIAYNSTVSFGHFETK